MGGMEGEGVLVGGFPTLKKGGLKDSHSVLYPEGLVVGDR
jgi:hypothetical protein